MINFIPKVLRWQTPRGVSTVSNKGPRRAHRKGKSLLNLAEMFPDEDSAVKRIEFVLWGDGCEFPSRKGTCTYETKNGN